MKHYILDDKGNEWGPFTEAELGDLGVEKGVSLRVVSRDDHDHFLGEQILTRYGLRLSCGA